VGNLLSQGLLLSLIELLKRLKQSRVLGDESTLPQERKNVGRKTLCLLPGGDIIKELLTGNARKRVADLALEVLLEILGDAGTARLVDNLILVLDGAVEVL
jgi:hypothetical protein